MVIIDKRFWVEQGKYSIIKSYWRDTVGEGLSVFYPDEPDVTNSVC